MVRNSLVSFLGFAKDGKYDLKPTDLNHLIKKTASMFGRTKKEIKMGVKLESNLWHTAVDQGQIKQVLLNLYVNAWQAMPDGVRHYHRYVQCGYQRESREEYRAEGRAVYQNFRYRYGNRNE